MKKGLLFIISFVILCTSYIMSCDISYASKMPTYKKEVRGKVVDKTNPRPVYSVDVYWGAMNFTYSTVVTPVWNETNHVYDDTYKSEWKAEGNTITLTNHSNVGVQARFRYIKLPKYNDVSGQFNNTSIVQLPSAKGKKINDKDLTKTTDLILSGKIEGKLNEFTRVGNIKIEID